MFLVVNATAAKAVPTPDTIALRPALRSLIIGPLADDILQIRRMASIPLPTLMLLLVVVLVIWVSNQMGPRRPF